MRYFIKAMVSVSVLSLLLLSACNMPLAASSSSISNNSIENNSATPQTGGGAVIPMSAAISHSQTPPDPIYLPDQIATDCNTGAKLLPGSDKIVINGCDYWSREWLERPAASAGGAYIPSLDILWSQAGKSEPWVYLKIKVSDLSQMPAGYKAGFEIDDNLDSRGDFLILALEPKSTSWTTDGVQVWQDTNGDVGGSIPFHYDKNAGDGYETNLVDSGKGKDPDLAWARISPNDPNTIEFAFKSQILPNPNVFGWWAWVGLDSISPAKFELVDHSQDGTTWSVDNTCSWIYGLVPTAGQLANLCAIVPPTPTVTPTPLPVKRYTPTPTQIIIK